MPNDFGDPIAETKACLTSAALFDYSFLLRFRTSGSGVAEALSRLCGRDLSTMANGDIRYVLTTDEEGYLRSDLTVWRIGPESFEIFSGRAEDAIDIAHHPDLGMRCLDLSDETAVLALQGPTSLSLLRAAFDAPRLAAPERFRFVDAEFMGAPCRIGRLGFTGLDGVEIVCSTDHAQPLWDRLIDSGLGPAGFRAADRIRLAAGLALFSKEFAPPVSAADAGLARFRPAGDKALDRLPARVRRVCCETHASALTDASLVDLARLEYRHGDQFPPEPGKFVLTSVNFGPTPETLFAMGYVAADTRGVDCRDSHGVRWTIRP
jgi:aminomethyltransferase